MVGKERELFEELIYFGYSSVLLKTNSSEKVASKTGEPIIESSTDTNKESVITADKIGKEIKTMNLYITPFRGM